MSEGALHRVCFDASAACAFALDDEPKHAEALSLVAELVARDARIIAPPLFLYECDSVIRLRIYKGVLDLAEAQAVRRIISTLAVAIDHVAVYDRAFYISCLTNQPRTYDSAYAALAEARKIELWTADSNFYNATVSVLPFVKLLGQP